jgi:hypothetical protein
MLGLGMISRLTPHSFEAQPDDCSHIPVLLNKKPTMTQLFAVLIGAGFTAVGLLFMNYGLPRTTTMMCERSQSQQINCHQQETTAGIPTGKRNLEDIRNIEMISFEVPSGDGDIEVPRHQILLSAPQGTLIFGISSHPEELQPTLEKLKSFQQESSSRSTTVYGSTVAWTHLVVGSLAAGLGSWLVIAPITAAFKSQETIGHQR